MKHKIPFFPILGCLTGGGSAVGGILLVHSVNDITSLAAKLGAAGSESSGGNFFSSFFGGGQSSAASDSGTLLMLSKLCELMGKGFGLLLIFLGLGMIFLFASKIEKAVSAAHVPPAPPLPIYDTFGPAPDYPPVYADNIPGNTPPDVPPFTPENPGYPGTDFGGYR